MKKLALLLSLVVLNVRVPAQSSSGPLLLREPTVSRTQIAFSYAGDIWPLAPGCWLKTNSKTFDTEEQRKQRN